MSRVLVVGGSDQGRQVIDAMATTRDHEVFGVLDGNLAPGILVEGVPVIGSTADLPGCADDVGADGFVVAIGDNTIRADLVTRVNAAAPKLELVTVIHETAIVARDAFILGGTILLAGAVVGNGSVLGRGVLLGTASSIDHDCTLDDFVSLAPGVHTAGTVRIGRATALGVGASVIHQVTIGPDTVVGAGAVVLADLPGCVVAYGVPAKVARTREPGESYLS
jgi:sugar O-acyltransferase (sialic acid O-acetyltransferase NeuD family)